MAEAIDLSGLVRPQLVEATGRTDDPNVTEFRVQPLERGFGHTLGNAMRRMLLSSLRGAAVWGFRIDGVVHEHQTLQGVVEDVHQIIGNLKTLTLTLPDDVDDVVVRITKRSSGVVTAGDIEGASGVRIVDPSHHLFTLHDDREVRVELYVNKGRGYVEADQHPLPRDLPVDLVRIDSIYNPVRRANFAVTETRVGQRTDYDRLTLTVETNGTITPEEAVSYAAALAQTHFQYFVGFGSALSAPVSPGGELSPVDAKRFAELFKTPVEKLEMGTRAVNSLRNSKIETLGDLVKFSQLEMVKVKKFGRKSFEELANLFERHNLNFGMKFEEDGDGVRILDWGAPPNRAAAAGAPDDDEE
jgi:DNA-directed RNA polymerase subunit alpha